MAWKFVNNAVAEIKTGISAVATTLTLQTGHGARFPAVSGGDFFFVTLIKLSDPSQLEIVKVTARSGDNLTIVRAQELTTAKTFVAGDRVEMRPTAGMFDTIYNRKITAGAGLTGGGDFQDDRTIAADLVSTVGAGTTKIMHQKATSDAILEARRYIITVSALSSNKTAATADLGILWRNTSATTYTMTLPTGLGVGSVIYLTRTSTGGVKFAAGTGASLAFPSDRKAEARGANSTIAAIATTSSQWLIVGDMASA